MDRNPGVPERLLAVSAKLFADRGFDRTSVQDIVEAAGVTKGALYHYFSSKDELLQEVYRRWLERQTERLAATAANGRPVAERLRSAAVDIVEMCIENLDDNKIFWRSMHQLEPSARKLVRADRRIYHELLRGLVEEGQTAGVFGTATPADLVVHHFTGSLHHFSSWYRPDGELSPRGIGEHYADLLLASLRPG